MRGGVVGEKDGRFFFGVSLLGGGGFWERVGGVRVGGVRVAFSCLLVFCVNGKV